MQLKLVYLSKHIGTSLSPSTEVRQVARGTKRRNRIELKKGQKKRPLEQWEMPREEKGKVLEPIQI